MCLPVLVNNLKHCDIYMQNTCYGKLIRYKTLLQHANINSVSKHNSVQSMYIQIGTVLVFKTNGCKWLKDLGQFLQKYAQAIQRSKKKKITNDNCSHKSIFIILRFIFSLRNQLDLYFVSNILFLLPNM